MNIKEFFGKFVSKYILLNLMAMAILVALIVFGVKYGLDEYTRHGEEIEVPDLYSMTFLQAKELLELNGMTVLVSDSGHNKKMAAGCVLAQNPKAGSHVKYQPSCWATGPCRRCRGKSSGWRTHRSSTTQPAGLRVNICCSCKPA